jgi:hypothetical protein
MKPLTYWLGAGFLISAMSNGYAQSIVHPNWNPLPPLEFDYPYGGVLTIVRSEADFPDWHLCPQPPKPREMLACAIRFRKPDGTLTGRCSIYIAKDATLAKNGISYEDVLRHEMAHCNGWGSDHAGARPLGSPRLTAETPAIVRQVAPPAPPVIDTRSGIPEIACPSGQVTEPCR